MSRANLYVLFPDGSLRYGIYNGTADIALPTLSATPEGAWDAWRSGQSDWYDTWRDGDGEPVRVATDYGGGFCWRATATPDRLTSGHDPHENYAYSDGLPDWATYPCKEPVTDEHPEHRVRE